jgi:signal transduction histidine kinase
LLESGNLTLKYTLCNINQLLEEQEEVFNKHLRQEQNSELTLKISIPVPDVFFVTDAVRLKQIFSYLISNAIRFSETGAIEIGYLVDPEDSANSTTSSLTFYIKDNGIGIEKEHQQDIFKPFYKIENTCGKIYGGTGIGLAIAKNLLDLLEGKIWVDSELEKGSTFYFKIPTTKNIDDLVNSL